MFISRYIRVQTLFKIKLSTSTAIIGLLILVLSVLSAHRADAQNTMIQYGKIASSDILMKSYPSEPSAEAAILVKQTSLKYIDGFESGQIKRHFERIKIFKSTAFDLADVVIEFYHFDGLEKVTELNAMITYPDGSIYNLNEGNVKKVKIGTEWTQVKLEFPKLTEGCIIEYEYALVKAYISEPEDFVFQYEFPVRYAEFSYSFPEHYEYIFIPQRENFIDAGDGYFRMSNIPSLKPAPFVTTVEDHRGKIKTQINRYHDSFSGTITLNPSILDLVKGLVRNRQFGYQYINKTPSKKIISAARGILAKVIPIENKIDSLQNFLLNEVSWDGTNELYSKNGINKAFKNRLANSTELNMMFIALLRSLNIKAYPVLVSSRDNGQIYRPYPSISNFTHAIVFATIEGKNVLLDISDPLKPAGLINFAALNNFGLVIKADEPFWIEILPDQVHDAYFGEYEIINQQLVGKFQGKHSHYSAYLERDYSRDGNFLDHWKLRFQQKYPRAYVHSAKLENLKNLNEDFRQEFELSIPGALSFKGDTLIVDPYLYGLYDKNPFVTKDRAYEVNFGYPFTEQYFFLLKVPENYEILTLPEQVTMSTEDRSASLQISSSFVGGKIQIMKRLDIAKAVYTPEEYMILKSVFDAIELKSKEKIVLIAKKE